MEKLLQDLEILKKDYSSYRGASKWRSARSQSVAFSPDLLVDGNIIKIFRKSISMADYYPIPNLLKRQEIKRSTSVFQQINNLWQMINPASLRSISKPVYLVVIEAFYKQFQQSMANRVLIGINLTHDSEIDFQNKLGLTFAEFYDIIFEIVDSLTKSSLIGEYSRIINSTLQTLQEQTEFASLNLYGKIHLKEPQRVMFYKWMQKNFRDLTPNKKVMQLPEILKNSSTYALPPKFLNRSNVRIVREDTPIKWNAVKIMDIYRKSKSPLRSITPKLERKKISSSYKKIEIEKKNPLSITPKKDRKNTHLLEDIIQERSKVI